MSDGFKGFDWERAKQRRAAGMSSASFGNVDLAKASSVRIPGSGPVRGASWARAREQMVRLPKESKPKGDIVCRITASKAFGQFGSLVSSPKITGCAYIASYNWVEGEKPVILVPGAPRTWKPVELPCQLEEDSGEFYRDINAAKWGEYPMEPAVRSVFEVNEQFDTKTIDIVTCAATLGHLFRFASGERWEFEFDIDLIGNTVFLTRKENSPKELLHDVRGYGHTFPAASTHWDNEVKGSISHQRIVSYDFGGLTILLRFESDGHFTLIETDPKGREEEKKEETDSASLVEAAKAITLSEGADVASGSLEIKRRGTRVPHDAIFDIKTRSKGNGFDRDHEMPRLWVRQVQHLIVAYHSNGEFKNVDIQNVNGELRAWEKKNEATLMRLVAVLFQLIDVAKGAGAAKFKGRREGDGFLEISRRTGDPKGALPDDLRALWKKNTEGTDGVGTDENDEEEIDDLSDLLLNY